MAVSQHRPKSRKNTWVEASVGGVLRPISSPVHPPSALPCTAGFYVCAGRRVARHGAATVALCYYYCCLSSRLLMMISDSSFRATRSGRFQVEQQFEKPTNAFANVQTLGCEYGWRKLPRRVGPGHATPPAGRGRRRCRRFKPFEVTLNTVGPLIQHISRLVRHNHPHSVQCRCHLHLASEP